MVGVPRAEVVFRGPERVRVRIPDRRGDAGYYREVAEKLTDALVPLRIEVNAHTASVLITGAPVDVQALAETAMAQGLFCLKSTPPPRADSDNGRGHPFAIGQPHRQKMVGRHPGSARGPLRSAGAFRHF
jgi:hypothetical protein